MLYLLYDSEQFTNVDIGRELVDPGDGSCESPRGLVHSRPSEEGSFSWWLKAQAHMINILNLVIPSSYPLLQELGYRTVIP